MYVYVSNSTYTNILTFKKRTNLGPHTHKQNLLSNKKLTIFIGLFWGEGKLSLIGGWTCI